MNGNTNASGAWSIDRPQVFEPAVDRRVLVRADGQCKGRAAEHRPHACERCGLQYIAAPIEVGRFGMLTYRFASGPRKGLPVFTLQTLPAEPRAYLGTLFTELPNASPVEEIEALLPAPADSDSLARVS